MSQADSTPGSRHLTAPGTLRCKQDAQMSSELQTEERTCPYRPELLPKWNASTAHIKNKHPGGGGPWTIKARSGFTDRVTDQISFLTGETKSSDGAIRVVKCRAPVASDVEQKNSLPQDTNSHLSSNEPDHDFCKYTESPAVLPKSALKRSCPSSPSQPGDNTSLARVGKRVRFSSPSLIEVRILTPYPTPSPPPRTQPSDPKKMKSLETIRDLSLRLHISSPAVSSLLHQTTTSLEEVRLRAFQNVTFDRSQKYGFCVHYFENNSIRYTLSEELDFFINGHKRLKPRKIFIAGIRCSRWSKKNDWSLSFYYSQLLHRGLPTTVHKEVAKWRLYENASRVAKGSGKDQKQRLNAIHNIKLELQNILETTFPTLQGLPRDFGGDAQHKWENSGHGDEIEQWMIEEQTNSIEPGDGYGLVLKAWLSVRHPLQKAEEGTALEEDLEEQGGSNESEHMRRHARTRLKKKGSKPSGRGKRLVEPRKERQRRRNKHRACRRRGNSHRRAKVDEKGKAQEKGAEEQASEEQSKSGAEKEVRKALEQDRPKWAARMMDWVCNNFPELLSQQSRATETGGPRPMSISDICGHYALIPIVIDDAAASEQQLHTAAELVLAHTKGDTDEDDDGGGCGNGDRGAIYGRFRLGRHIHGLIKVATVPDKSTTDPVWMNMVIEDPEAQDGSWVTEADDYGAAGAVAVPRGMIFLGGNPGLLILGHETMFGKATRIVFGVKTTGGGGEDGTALGKGLKESWDSIWGIFRGMNVQEESEKEKAVCAVKADDREVGWEEIYVDCMIDSLR